MATYALAEAGRYTGNPIELYRFTGAFGQVWTYTSGDVPFVYAAETYIPAVIRRSPINANHESGNATVEVSCEVALDVVDQFIAGTAPVPIALTIMRRHRTAITALDFASIFVGEVAVCEFEPGEARLTCVPVQKAIQRNIPRMIYQTMCNNNLYDSVCQVDPGAYAVPGTITAASADGRTLTIPEADVLVDGWFNAGFMVIGTYRAFIMTHVGAILTLLAAVPGAALGAPVVMYPGCDRTAGVCGAKFFNIDNFMGFPMIPDRNPYDGLT